ncbi:MAG TPA: tetratricopeptide repeat protein [Tepidisphaeraceae bacterium]|nr:tetratricopeptide repeat protein [Tepidisphaeraceae bacterium]
MASRRAEGRLTQLWQLPLLLISLGLFAYAAYLFIDPKPGLSVSQRISLAEGYLKNKRFGAAVEQCNKLLATEKLTPTGEARIHLLLAETLDIAQKEERISIPANHEQIIEQTRLALAEGGKVTSDVYRRLGESHEALGHVAEALDGYRRAMTIDPNRALPLRRKVIDLQLLQDDPAPAEASLEDYLKDPKLADSERAWALDAQAQVLIKRARYSEARPLLDKALRLDADLPSQGIYHYRLGLCAWKQGDMADAERLLRVSRDQMKAGHPLDPEAAYLLGRIRQAQNDPKEAIAFYDSVLTNYPEARPAPLARLGRGLCRVMLGQNAGALADLHEMASEPGPRANHQLFKTQAIAGLRQASVALAAKDDFQGALEVLADEQSLVPDPGSDFYTRLADVFARRAQQVQASVAAAPTEADRIGREQQVRQFRTRAGDAYIALSRALTLSDDRGNGDALWKGVDLYDRAGALPQTISALELFAAQRPADGLAPDVLLRLGRAYQAAGQVDKAIATFERNQFRYPQSLAASKSGVPLAEALMAKGADGFPKAQRVLLAVVENNLILDPNAEEFRQALFELAQLYYRTDRYEEAIARLDEMTQRYPRDPDMAQLVFLMADSYRKSAGLLNAKTPTPTPTRTTPGSPLAALAVQAKAAFTATNFADAAGSAAAGQAEANAARHDRLGKAKRLFDRVVDLFREKAPSRDLDKLYLKLSHFYRADCLYDLGQFELAIKSYDSATLRYPDDPASVAADVQIVNAYCALGRFDDARAANERAKWLLKRMPADAFNDGRFSMPKKYWDDWLRWTSESGMYARPKGAAPATRPAKAR